jgi:hypothetical protein
MHYLFELFKIFQVPAKREWKRIQEAFKAKWNFPNCCGAIDGKHCQIKRADNGCSEFYNYKETYSIILFALGDADYRFVFIYVGRVCTTGCWVRSAAFSDASVLLVESSTWQTCYPEHKNYYCSDTTS